MPKGIVLRARLASLALIAALATFPSATAAATPRRALLQGTVAESVASISQAVVDVADSAAQAVVDVANRIAEEAEASTAPAPAPGARRRSLLQSETPVLTRLEREIMKEQRKIAEKPSRAAIEATAPESMVDAVFDDFVDAEAPEATFEGDAADKPRRRALFADEAKYDVEPPAPAPAPEDLIDVEELTPSSTPVPATVPLVAEPDLGKRRRSLLQVDYVDYVGVSPSGSPVDALDLAGAPAPAPAPA